MSVSVNPNLAGTGSNGAAAAAPVDSVVATSTLTSNNTNVTAGKKVTLNGKVYTFVNALTPLEGEVLKAGTADLSMTNLVSAINHAGTPGTDYSAALAHPTVSAGAVSGGHATTLSSRVSGAVGNAITLTTDEPTYTPGGATFTGGINGTPGTVGQIAVFSSVPYICMAPADTTTAGAWKKWTVAAIP